MNHIENNEKSFTKIDAGAAILSESAGLGLNTRLSAMRESLALPDKIASQFPSADALLSVESIGQPRIPGVDHSGDNATGEKPGKSSDTTAEWPKEPKPSEIFQGHSRNLMRAGELFPGIDPESVHKNQLAQRYLNSKEHLGDQPLTKEEEEELFKNPEVKKRLDAIVKSDSPQPRFN